MEKYHVLKGFKDFHVIQAEALIEAMQARRLSFTSHALQELSAEAEAVKIGQFLLNYRLNFSDVFELAINEAGRLEKLGFRVKFAENDIIFILSSEKSLVTLWTNSKFDCHKTLNLSLYCKV
jgi:hypothetical protein